MMYRVWVGGGAQVPRVKICGIRDAASALVAAQAGADFVGLIFVKKVRTLQG